MFISKQLLAMKDHYFKAIVVSNVDWGLFVLLFVLI